MEEEGSPGVEPQMVEMKPEPLTVIEQDEVASPQPTIATASQAMKGTDYMAAVPIRAKGPDDLFSPSTSQNRPSVSRPAPPGHDHPPRR